MSIRVLIVEDSPVVTELLCHILGSDPALLVVGTATNGAAALEAVPILKPDVITMDISMPLMDGYEATRKIMETNPVPIVIVSVSVDPGEVATTFRALEEGALAAVTKPVGIGHSEYAETAKNLLETVKLMSEVKVVRRWPLARRKLSASVAPPIEQRLPAKRDLKIIAMGASTGGPTVLKTILSKIPESFPLPILIVQHISPGFIDGFAQALTNCCKLPVCIPTSGEMLLSGHVYLAPDRMHMGVGPAGRITLSNDPPENGMRPSVSYLFRCVAEVFGPESVGVLLTGMGRDGADGLKSMRDKGAFTIAQDEESCVVFGMPAEAIRVNAASRIFSPDQVVSFLTDIAETNPDGL